MVVRSIIAKIFLSAALLLFAQEGRSFQSSGRTRTLGGYARTISGTVADAGGPIAPANKVLLVRATDGASTMIWETETVPTDAGQDSIAFLWLAGLGCNYGEFRFNLAIEGKEVLTFTTSSQDSWEVVGADGIRLQCETLHKDMYKDHYGFMRLVFPPGLATPGKPVRLQITGKAERSMCWVMTYTWRPESGITASSRSVIMRVKAASVQPVDLEIVNIDKPTTATVRVAGQPAEKLDVPFGVTLHTVHVPPVEKEKTLGVEFEMGKVSRSTTVSLIPAKHWTVYLVQQTHTDIGYTRPQTEILAEHLRYIDYVLDYCDQTDSFPDDAKFRWTCETTWAVREYLKARPPHQIARLKKRIQEGRIEVTGMLLNWSEVADENLLVQSLEPIAAFRKAGIPVRTAMQDDVNGFAWCLVDYFDGLGIKYVTSGINTDRSIKPFNYPTPFWWESPSGKRVLAYRGDIYGQGNFVNIHSDDFSLVERALPPYLRQLEVAGYPYDRVNIQYNGYMTDNSPPSTMSCENIRRWNETYDWPKLRSATVSEFLEWVEREHAKTLPVYRAAWPDWWTDGFGCATRETAAGRQAQADLIANQGLLSMAQLLGASLPQPMLQQVQAVADNLHFYNEHTFGAAESISDPLAENTQVQWSEKSSYPWQAVMESRLLREAAVGQLQQFLPVTNENSIVLINTLNWKRSGLHVLFADNRILPKETEFRIVDEKDKTVPVQLLQSRSEGSYWALWANEVPPMGYAAYRVVSTGASRKGDPRFEPKDTLQNAFYRLVIDRKKGAISSLVDLELGRELLDPARSWQLAEFIHEKLADRSRMRDQTHSTLQNVRFAPGIDGPLWQSIVMTGSGNGFADDGLTCEIRLFKTAKQIDLVFKGRKLPVTDPEAVYIAFPFSLQGGKLWFEAQGGMVRPGENQIPGTANDWNAVQNFASLRGTNGQIVLTSSEIPLMQFGGINTGRYNPTAKPETQQIFSWVLNNYWTTNFRASQEGEMTWSYSLTSGPDTSNTFATQFGWGIRVPLISRVLPKARTASSQPPSFSAWPFGPSSLLLVSARPAKQGIILLLREVEGKNATLDFVPGTKGWKMEGVDALGDPLRRPSQATFKPLEAKFIRIWKTRS